MAVDITKISAIQKHFSGLVGCPIRRYHTAELNLADGTWVSWPDLPIRVYAESGAMVAVSWARFDDLWLANDESLPFDAEDATTRWVENGIGQINGCLGRVICGVMLGREGMTWGGSQIEIWTRLLIDLDDCWLEIVNALDENGYAFHTTMPIGEFVKCL